MRALGQAINELELLMESDEVQIERNRLLDQNKASTEFADIDFFARNIEIHRRMARRQKELTILTLIRDLRVIQGRMAEIMGNLGRPLNRQDLCRVVGGDATPFVVDHMVNNGILGEESGIIFRIK